MSSVPEREKISEKILKEWESIEDEAIIREVATKGKYINLSLTFLAKRNNKSIADTRHYFHTEVDKYVHRLLTNRQVHKAELVLKNVGRESQIIFYEFVQSSSKEHIDEEIKECVLEHIQKCCETFERDRDEYDYYLMVLRLVITNKTLKKSFEQSVPEFTLESLYRNDEAFRKRLAVATCLQCRSAALVERLDQRVTWEYLLRNEQFHYVTKWLDLCYENKKTGSPEVKYNKKELSYDVAIRNLFSSWDIDDEMFAMVSEQGIEDKLKDFVLNSFAKNGFLTAKEKEDIVKILYRMFTTESFNHNQEWVTTVPNILKLVRVICNKDELAMLTEKLFTKDVILEVSTEYPQLQKEIELCVALKDTDFSDPQDLAQISAQVSQYISDTSDKDFYQKLPFVYFFEHLLRDTNINDLAESPEAKQIISKLPFIDAFMQKIRTKTSLNDYDVSLDDLLKTKNINLDLVRSEAQATTNCEDPIEPLSFSNHVLSLKYAQTTALTYIHYINQHRSSYAAYHFFLDQLRNYSQIGRPQIQIVCSTVSELAINSLDDRDMITHCLAFVEMLGINTQILRAYINCLRLIKDYGEQEGPARLIESEVYTMTETILLQKLEANNCRVDPREMDALKVLIRSRNVDTPIDFLKRIASNSNWFHFLLFASYYNYSIRSMINVCQMDCFENRNIGLNVGRALKEIIVDDEMPAAKRTASFSYREHKKKIQSKNESTHLLNASSRTLSTSISLTEQQSSTKFISSQYLNINDDTDLFAIILLCTVEASPLRETTLNVKLLKELITQPDIQQTVTYLNLLRFAFKLKWPVLSVVAAMTNDAARDYCWAVWLIISMGKDEINCELKTLEQLSRTLITQAVQENFVRTLHQSIEIFYPESHFGLFTNYLSATSHHDFSFGVTRALQSYLTELNENNVTLSCLTNYHKDEMLSLTIDLLVDYATNSFNSMEHRQLLLESLCASGISDYTSLIDFCTIKTINKILTFTSIRLNVQALMRQPCETEDSESLYVDNIQREYERICEELIIEKSFKKAMEIADLLNLPRDNIVYEGWIDSNETDDNFCLDVCEHEIERYSLSPHILINFLIFVADKIGYDDPKKYKVLKKVLDAIKKHHLQPNENFQRDNIEYDLVMCVLRNSVSIPELDMYDSEYFETVMVAEKTVLYKSFMDLKEMAGVNELTVLNREPLNNYELGRLEELMNKLLDRGDIVQALRLQAMFNHRTLDLHYLVFCMALAEGLASLYELSVEQRQMLNDGAKNAASKFNRRTLRMARLSQSSSSSSPTNRVYMEALENTRVDFEDVPSKEKQDLLEAIQSLASRVKHGFKLAQRIAMAFRSAMYLEKEYVDVLKTKDPFILLNNAINEECLNRLLVMSDIMTSMQMTRTEIADFMAEQISKSIIKSRFYLLQNPLTNSFGQNFLWGYDLDKELHLFLELCPNTSILGTYLLKYCDVLKIYRKFDANRNIDPEINGPQQNIGEMRRIFNNLRQIMESQVLSHKKQNTINVELLIKAHDCFVHECSMEGIANVLQRCKTITSTLATAKSWHLIVRLLMGVGRYRDMYYCFESLIKNEQFESLLGQFDEERTNGLKEAIITYLHENYPDDKENYRLAALHFQMYRELAQMSEMESKTAVVGILAENEIKYDDSSSVSSLSVNRSQSDIGDSASGIDTLVNGNLSLSKAGASILRCKKDLADQLMRIMDGYAHAAENYLLENKLGLAQRAASNAELVALQINLVRAGQEDNKDTCICVLNVRSEGAFRHIVNYELNVPQALILSRGYPYEINWTEAIFNQYIIKGKDAYIIEYCARMELTEDMIEVLVKNFLQMTSPVTARMEQSVSHIVEMVKSVTLRYKLASLLSDKRIIANLINDQSIYYLKDTNYGRNDSAT